MGMATTMKISKKSNPEPQSDVPDGDVVVSQDTVEVKVEHAALPDRLSVDTTTFGKLIYDLTQGYTIYWTGLAGQRRLIEMCGVSSPEVVKNMYEQLKARYFTSLGQNP